MEVQRLSVSSLLRFKIQIAYLRLVSDYNCNNDESSLPVYNPGYAQLGWGNDAFSSIQCFRT